MLALIRGTNQTECRDFSALVERGQGIATTHQTDDPAAFARAGRMATAPALTAR
jgi:hypothetical protein